MPYVNPQFSDFSQSNAWLHSNLVEYPALERWSNGQDYRVHLAFAVTEINSNCTTAYRSRVCDNVVEDGQWRDLYLPVYSGFPNCDDRRPNCDAFFNGVLLHGYHSQLGLNFSSKIQKRKVHQCC